MKKSLLWHCGLTASGALALLSLVGCVSHQSAVTPAGRISRVSEAAAKTHSNFAKPPTEERPGLATGWGEQRDSRIKRSAFRRTHRTSPSATGRLFYNDRQGAGAMMAQYGVNPVPVSGLHRLPGGFLSVGLRDGNGDWLPGWDFNGHVHIIGEQGSRYEVVVRNESLGRIEVVTSVDGLDVLDGKPASYRKRGYVLNPGETYAIDGFRKSCECVAAFRFSSVSQSYAALQHGDTRNVGVIGFAVFPEKDREIVKRQEANPFPGY